MIDVKLLFAILGSAFLLLGCWRCLRAGRLVVQARTFFLVGSIFSLVALWLRFH